MDIPGLMLAQLESLDSTRKMIAQGLFRSETDLCKLDAADFSHCTGVSLTWARKHWKPAELLRQAHGLADLAEHRRWRTLGLWEGDYPYLLRESPDPPFLLWWAGAMPEPDTVLVAVVGTRRPSEDGRRAAWDLGRACGELGLGHLSGLAFGIDAASHAGCLEAGGASLAVLPSGLDCLSPRAHASLAGRIVDRGGALVTEYVPGVRAAPWRFLVRNRIIAGLSPLTVVVEAPLRSGAISSAGHALAAGRDVWVHAAGTGGPRSGGTRKLVFEGARIFSSLGEVIGEYDWIAGKIRGLAGRDTGAG